MSDDKPKRGDDVLIEGMAKEIRSLRKKNANLQDEIRHLKSVLEQIRPMARIGARIFSSPIIKSP